MIRIAATLLCTGCATLFAGCMPLTDDRTISVDYSTFLGGSGVDDCDAIAVDTRDAIYLGCHTDSPDFSGPDSMPLTIKGELDAIVVKLAADGRSIAYRTQIGGAGWEAINAIATGPNGSVWAAGATYSAGLPVSAQAPGRTYAGGEGDAFIVKLDAQGKIVFLTYLGGTGADDASGIAIDRRGNVYVAGRTTSADFPTTRGTLMPTYRDSMDAFVAKVSSAGELMYSTFLGGSLSEAAFGLAVDDDGNVHVAGQTRSPDFPTVNALQPQLAGEADAFITVLDGAGNRILFSSFLGGSAWDQINGITLDNSRRIYLTGSTRSGDFRISPSASRPSPGGKEDALVAALSPLGKALLHSTILGGSANESGAQVAVNHAGQIAITGGTESADLPTQLPLQAALRGTLDGFIVWTDSRGRTALTTYFGGSDRDLFEDAALDSRGRLVVTGLVGSADYPVRGALQHRFAGGWRDVIVSRFVLK